MSAIVLVEHDNQRMNPSTRNTLTAALKLDPKPSCLVLGSDASQVAEEVAKIAGVARVLYVDDPLFKHPLAEAAAAFMLSLHSRFDAFLAPASVFGKNILPRLAALLDVTQVSDVTAVLDAQCFEHPIYAGNAIEVLRVLDPVRVLTVRSTAFSAILESQAPCPIEPLKALPFELPVAFVGQRLTESTRPDLSSAKRVVSGGRGLQSAAQFKLIEELADALGAAVGASRAAVDAGFVPNDCQVGQTGKVVAPELYLAVGISGAIQHIAGMKDAQVIVAINKDEDAPIFQMATYGLVGDLFQIVPELIAAIKAL